MAQIICKLLNCLPALHEALRLAVVDEPAVPVAERVLLLHDAHQVARVDADVERVLGRQRLPRLEQLDGRVLATQVGPDGGRLRGLDC